MLLHMRTLLSLHCMFLYFPNAIWFLICFTTIVHFVAGELGPASVLASIASVALEAVKPDGKVPSQNIAPTLTVVTGATGADTADSMGCDERGCGDTAAGPPNVCNEGKDPYAIASCAMADVSSKSLIPLQHMEHSPILSMRMASLARFVNPF